MFYFMNWCPSQHCNQYELIQFEGITANTACDSGLEHSSTKFIRRRPYGTASTNGRRHHHNWVFCWQFLWRCIFAIFTEKPGFHDVQCFPVNTLLFCMLE